MDFSGDAGSGENILAGNRRSGNEERPVEAVNLRNYLINLIVKG